MSKKSNTTEKMNRVSRVYSWLLEGNSRSFIVQNGSKIWKVCHRQVDDYIAQAREKIKNNLQLNLEFELSLARERYERLYMKAYSYISDEKKKNLNTQHFFNGIKVCLEIQREISDLIGLKNKSFQVIQEMEREKHKYKRKPSMKEIDEINRILCKENHPKQ